MTGTQLPNTVTLHATTHKSRLRGSSGLAEKYHDLTPTATGWYKSEFGNIQLRACATVQAGLLCQPRLLLYSPSYMPFWDLLAVEMYPILALVPSHSAH